MKPMRKPRFFLLSEMGAMRANEAADLVAVCIGGSILLGQEESDWATYVAAHRLIRGFEPEVLR